MNFALIFYLKDRFGGAERRFTRIYNELCAENPDMHCDIVIRGCNKKTALKLFAQADCMSENIDKIIAFKSPIICLIYLLMRKKYSAVHFFSASKFNNAVVKICAFSNKKSIYTICGYREACNVSISKEGTELVKYQLANADIVDLLNPSGIEYVKQFIRGDLYITPGTFTDLEIFKPQMKEKTILYVAARLEDIKNPGLLVEATNICQNEIRKQGFRVILLGKSVEGDELEERLKKKVKEYGIQDILEMPGYGKTSSYIPQASIFLSLQKIENYPSQSLAEAVASGCYLIVTDVGDSRKCADESFASFIKDDPKELAAAMKKYFSFDDIVRSEVIKNARLFAEKNYSIEPSKAYFKKIMQKAERRI